MTALQAAARAALRVPLRVQLLVPLLVPLLAGCAGDAPRVATAVAGDGATAPRRAEDCVRVTGSNVCRQARAGGLSGTDNTMIVSGDAIRRTGAPVAGPEATKIEP